MIVALEPPCAAGSLGFAVSDFNCLNSRSEATRTNIAGKAPKAKSNLNCKEVTPSKCGIESNNKAIK